MLACTLPALVEVASSSVDSEDGSPWSVIDGTVPPSVVGGTVPPPVVGSAVPPTVRGTVSGIVYVMDLTGVQ